MDLFLYRSRTDNSKNLSNFQIFNIAKIGYVLRVISLKVMLYFVLFWLLSNILRLNI